jgi:hypothetical protein
MFGRRCSTFLFRRPPKLTRSKSLLHQTENNFRGTQKQKNFSIVGIAMRNLSHSTSKNFEYLTASGRPDDTCAAWSKRPNEEANPKESLCEEGSGSTPCEARECQAP